jgi:hypothetical protein
MPARCQSGNDSADAGEMAEWLLLIPGLPCGRVHSMLLPVDLPGLREFCYTFGSDGGSPERNLAPWQQAHVTGESRDRAGVPPAEGPGNRRKE